MKPQEGKKQVWNSGGGMYRGVSVPVQLLNWAIIIGMAVLIVTVVWMAVNGGYTVTFDAAGGTAVESQRVRYGELLEEPAKPYRQDYTFSGWYTDAAQSRRWDFQTDTVSQSLTLYAGWTPVNTK